MLRTHFSYVVFSILFLFAFVGVTQNHTSAFFSENGSWTTLDAPGSSYTRAFGVSGDNIVGDFGDSSGYHGFLYDGTTWTTLDAPGSRSTVAYGISGNAIVGYYNDESGRDHGFLYDGTTWTTLDVPGAMGTHAYGISGNNIVGHYQDETGDHGFLYDGTMWTTLDAPGAVGTYAFGISGSDIVGRYDANGVSHGFLYDGTTWATLDAPNSTFTDAHGVAGSVVIGSYTDASGAYGFIRTGAQWSILDAPSARLTQAYGISGNIIVGQFNDASNAPHGFVYNLAGDNDSSGDDNEDDSCSVVTLIDFAPLSSSDKQTLASKENLVVITHGWANGVNDHDAIGLLNTMRDNVCNHINKSTTAVLTYNWTRGSGTGTGVLGALVGTEYLAYINAKEAGKTLAIELLNLQKLPTNIHFIAHSAGSNVVQNTVYDIANYFDFQHANEVGGRSAPTVYLTFLDAFAPPNDAKTEQLMWGAIQAAGGLAQFTPMGLAQDYGNLYGLLGYAEQYVDSRPLANVAGFTLNVPDYTDIRLPNAVNFDVTYLDSVQGVHMWPVDFYNESIKDMDFTLPVSKESNEFKLGFPFSVESTKINSVSPEFTYASKWCIVTNVSEPYRRCFPDKVDENRDVILTDPNTSVTINVPDLATSYAIDVGQFIGFSGSTGSGELPGITIHSNIADVQIPDNTLVTSATPWWNGVITTPTEKSLSEAEIIKLIRSDGTTQMPVNLAVSSFVAFEVGSEGHDLSFENAVRIVIHNQAGKMAAFRRFGDLLYTYTEIPYCKPAVDSQNVGNDLPADGICKVDVGPNLVIWTKHFTTFVTYTEDTIAPTTTHSLSGTGGPGWYRSDVMVTLTATDTPDGSGVASTTYSLDNGVMWLDYTVPFTLTDEGTHTLQYRSVDVAGNVEETKTVTFYIDLTAPEAKISANASTKDLLVIGADNMGSTTVEKTATGYTITDEAGHTTKLTFKKSWNGNVLTLAQLTSIQYDDAPTVTLPKSSFLYVWTPWKGVQGLTNQTVHVNKTYTIDATYIKPLDKTMVIAKENGKQKQKKTYTGLKLVILTTNKGVVGYEL